MTNKYVDWLGVVRSMGVPGLHFHDLRHTGNMLAAASKPTTRDLMSRMGHDSMAAALIYQHASLEADRSIASHLNEQMQRVAEQLDARSGGAAEGALEGVTETNSGPRVARSGVSRADSAPVRHTKDV